MSEHGIYSAAFHCASNRAAFQVAFRITSEDVGAAARGLARTRARTQAAREDLQSTNLFGSAAAAGGVQRIRPAASTMATMPGLDQFAVGHTQFMALDANAQAEFLKERRAWKPVLGISHLSQGPSTIDTFTTVYEGFRKLADLLSVSRFFGAQEELGVSCIFSSFTGDAVAVARTAIATAFFFPREFWCLR